MKGGKGGEKEGSRRDLGGVREWETEGREGKRTAREREGRREREEYILKWEKRVEVGWRSESK